MFYNFFDQIKSRNYESYAHYSLLRFYPFCDESELKVGIPPIYKNKIADFGMINILNTKTVLMEPFNDAIHEVLLQYCQQ